MYRFLDRRRDGLARRDLFLLGAMRAWAGAAQRGCCPLDGLTERFDAVGAADAAADFAIAMAALHCDGVVPLGFAFAGYDGITDDEARLLALFDAPDALADRMAATLVRQDAAPHLARAAGRVAARLRGAPFPPTTSIDAES
jgi:hypothetical protein